MSKVKLRSHTERPTQANLLKSHHWSGWPGAFCLDCGCEDPYEIGLAGNLYDPSTGEWADTPEAQALRREAAQPCPGRWHKKCGQCVEDARRRGITEYINWVD